MGGTSSPLAGLRGSTPEGYSLVGVASALLPREELGVTDIQHFTASMAWIASCDDGGVGSRPRHL